MLTKGEIDRIDSERLLEDYWGWPHQCRKASQVEPNLPQLRDEPHRIIYVGMGGSACAGDLLQDWMAQASEIPVEVVRGYNLPRLDANALVLLVSVSGNTLETLSALAYAEGRGAKMAAFSSGGRLRELCYAKGIPHTTIPKAKTPRSSLPYTLYPVVRLIEELGLVKEGGPALREGDKLVQKILDEAEPDRPPSENRVLALALGLRVGIAAIHAPRRLRGVARRFKNSINENAKLQALLEEIPEAFHNSIEGWSADSPFRPVLLRHLGEDRGEEERFSFLKELLTSKGIDPLEVKLGLACDLSSQLAYICALDIATIYLAIILGRDPYPTTVIEASKSKLSSF